MKEKADFKTTQEEYPEYLLIIFSLRYSSQSYCIALLKTGRFTLHRKPVCKNLLSHRKDKKYNREIWLF